MSVSSGGGAHLVANNNPVTAAGVEEKEEIQRERIEHALLHHAYHLPGTTSWFADLWQYLSNNHPLLGICCHHPHHPLPSHLRAAALLGSIFFGLVVTNIIYLAFVFSDGGAEVYDKSYAELETNKTKTGLDLSLIHI